MCVDSYPLERLDSPLFTSRSSEIYLWEGSRLLKLFNAEVDPFLIENEKINTIEAYQKGVTKVKCYGMIQIENRTGMIIECVNGKPLISLAGAHPTTVFGVPRLMVELQIQLHDTQTDVIRNYKEMVISTLDSPPLAFLSSAEKNIIMTRLALLPDGNSILHLDYHPDNIMSDRQSATIIDWMTAARGVPAADVAATLYLLNEGEMIPGLNKAVAVALESVRKYLCKRYLKQYQRTTGMTDSEIAPWRLPFLIVRLGVWNIDSEVLILQKKIRAALNE